VRYESSIELSSEQRTENQKTITYLVKEHKEIKQNRIVVC